MTLNNTPFFLRPKLAIDVTVKAAREASIQAQARKMQLDNQLQQKPAHKSIFGKAIKLAAGIIPDPVENAVGDTVGGVEKGLNFWGNQVQSVPAALFTKGTVQNGQYTTKRNIIGNPLANVASHVKAQREAGVAPKSGGGLLGDIGAGFASARLAGEAFQSDPDISPVTKNVTGLAFDPTTYLAAGTLSKIPKIAAVGGAKGKLLRGGLGLAEGFDSPAQVAKFIVGSGAGTYLGEKVGHPNIGSFVGGGLTLAGAKKPAAKNALTEVVTDEERLHHATPNIIREGEIVTSPRGDIGAGHYTAKDPSHVEGYVEGDPANVTRFTDEHQQELRDKINTQGGQQVYRYKPTRDLFLLNWDQPIDKVEASRINNVLKKRGLSHRVAEGMSGGDVYNSFKDNEITPNGNTSNVTGVLDDAGFDGMTDGYSQFTIWRPNEVLKADLTPPKKAPLGKLPKGAQFGHTEYQLETMLNLLDTHPDTPIQTIADYIIKHTDSYGDKLPGHPTINEYLDSNVVDSVLSKLNQGEPHTPESKFTWDEEPDWTVNGDSTSSKPTGGIPNASELNQNYVHQLKKYGFIADSDNFGVKPMDFTDPGYDNYVYKNAYDALDWADANGHLDAAGKKQFDDVIKKMDEISPIKGAHDWVDKVGSDGEFKISNPKSIQQLFDETVKPKENTWTVAGKQINKTTLDKYTPLSSEQKKLVNKLADNLPNESMASIIDSVSKGTDTNGNWNEVGNWSWKPKPEKPVSPEDIIGNLDQKPQTTDEFIKYTEDTLGKPYENKDYPAQGQPGAPIAGQSISTKAVTPTKSNGMWSAAGHTNEDLGDLMDELIKAGYKVNPPEGFGPIAGGAAPETLVKPREVTVGLTPGEKISNALTKVKKAIFDHGVENNAVATPIAKEYIRINNVMKVQATNLGKLAQRAEKVLGISDVLNVDTSKFNPEQKAVMENLQRHMEAFDETLNQFDTKFDDIHTFAEKIRGEQGGEKKRFSDILTEYANAIGNKVSDKWLAGQINRLGDTVSMANEAGIPIPGKTVNLAGAKETKLPQEIADVLTSAVHKVHPTRDSEFASLFNAVNNTLRSMWAAGDASFQMIQQLPTWADNPKAAAKATLAGFHTLTDQTAMADFIAKHDAAVYGTGKPTVTEMISHGGYIAESLGGGTDLGGLAGKIERLPGYGKFLKKSNTLFTETGNANRIMIWDYLYDQYKNGGIDALNSIPGIKTNAQKGMTRDQVLDAIAAAGNRATGYSEHAFGGPYGSALFFAPRFMQSQIETVMKAAWGGGVENQVARRQLLKLVAIGTGITVAANATRGKETDFDPRSSNFMRIRDVGGSDLSVFGPWDTLVKGLVRSVPHVDQNGDFTVGEPQYLLRSKLSPVLSTTVDAIKGTNVIGQDTSNLDMTQLKNLLLPFSLRKVGEEPASASIFGFFGGKGSPLSANEVLDNKLSNAGIKQSDPDYLIKRRDYLAAHPEDVPKATGDKFKQAQEIQKDIASRRKLNDDKALSSAQTLADFRDNRTKLLKEQRDRLGEVLKGDANKGSTQQKKWLNSYFQLFDNPDTKDPITGDINGDKFDEAVAKWTNENGNTALDFVNRYMGAGLNQVESQYYKDLQTLDKAGYFKLPKYQNMKSNLTEDEISSLAQLVDSARVANPQLQSQPWALTAKRVLGHAIDQTELMDVIHSRLDKYANPERAKLKDKYAKELLWFNPRADWNSYTNFVPGKKQTKGVGSLKANLKPQLK